LTTTDVRASAQGLFNLVIIGFGVIAGNYFAGQVAEHAKGNWATLFGVPMWVTVGSLVALLLFYPRRSPQS